MDSDLTSRAASEDQLTDFIIDKDEQGVWEGAEPPVGPKTTCKKQMKSKLSGPNGQQGGGLAILASSELAGAGVFWGEYTHLRGYILRATSMPGQ